MSDTIWRWITLLGLAIGTAALLVALMLWDRLPTTHAPATHAQKMTADSERSPPAGPIQLERRTGMLSRLSPERRAVMRIQLQFAADGVMGVSCTAELADGGQSACFGETNGTGRWSLDGSGLCIVSAVINLAGNTCYQITGAGNQVVLSGPGLLAGVMFLR